ncbi:carotenoid oxygenase family protein [Phenylobacterium sp.]|jgi:carotenoid cleavage dioxygenase-like enzyme|uniref:carotenoid oxygenase family protein n=1 Tax=Phenylobacterium sp. TaxID=1871053 RepID=UPI002F92E22C
MDLSRRTLISGGAALSATAILSPERLWAAEAADWALAVSDVEADIAPRALRLVHGRAPAGLTGTLYRNGPAKFRYGAGEAAHWFDGDGLVRAFRIGDGQARLAARFVDTPKRRADQAANALVTPGFGTTGSARARVGGPDDLNAANTALLAVGGQLWALWEGGSPAAVDPETLATKGFVTLRDDAKGMPFLAHPRVEPDGRVWNLGMNGRQAVIWRLSASGALEDMKVIQLPRSSYVHDFTATDRELVIILQPWVREKLVTPLAAGMAWKPELGTQVVVIDKADLTKRRTYELPALFFFHLGDAWRESDGTIRFDGCVSDDGAFVTKHVASMTAAKPFEGSAPKNSMFVLHPNGRAEIMKGSRTAEFPRTDPRFAGLDRRYTWHVTGERSDRPLSDGVGVTDWRTGRTQSHSFGTRQLSEEAVFVPRPGSSAEGDGWLVGTSLNLKAKATELHVFDARRVADGPLCTWRSDVALPVGFHGVFVSA